MYIVHLVEAYIPFRVLCLYFVIIKCEHPFIEDGLMYHRHAPFSTYDKDNERHCARKNACGWWYRWPTQISVCDDSNLNGKHYEGGNYMVDYDDGIEWQGWYPGNGQMYSLQATSMTLIREH